MTTKKLIATCTNSNYVGEDTVLLCSLLLPAPEETKPDIIEAAKNGDISRIEEILSVDPGQVDSCSVQDGATPLMFAAMTGRLDIAQLLVQCKCDIDKQVKIAVT